MMRFLLDLAHTLHVVAGKTNLLKGCMWDDSLTRPGLTDKQFHLQPGIGFMRGRPDGGHFRQGITFDHDAKCSSVCYTSAVYAGVVQLYRGVYFLRSRACSLAPARGASTCPACWCSNGDASF